MKTSGYIWVAFCSLLVFGDPLPEGMSMEAFRTFLAANPYDFEHLPAFASRVSTEEDPVLRAHYMATCYLGFLVAGDREAALKAYDSLKEHHPESLYPEKIPPSRLVKVCPDCRRTPQIKIPCPVCHGSNRCGTCKGKKHLEGLSEKKSCPGCQGTGQCKHCDRKGRVFGGSCSTCQNKRIVLNEERVMRFYKILLLAEEKEIRKKRGVHLNWDPPRRLEKTGTE